MPCCPSRTSKAGNQAVTPPYIHGNDLLGRNNLTKPITVPKIPIRLIFCVFLAMSTRLVEMLMSYPLPSVEA